MGQFPGCSPARKLEGWWRGYRRWSTDYPPPLSPESQPLGDIHLGPRARTQCGWYLLQPDRGLWGRFIKEPPEEKIQTERKINPVRIYFQYSMWSYLYFLFFLSAFFDCCLFCKRPNLKIYIGFLHCIYTGYLLHHNSSGPAFTKASFRWITKAMIRLAP